MHLVAALAAGIVGADNGTARLFRRGTSTRATWYSDFEASVANSSGDDIGLDSSGSAIVYVNELVQVRIYDSLGELKRDFVAGDQAYSMEVISSAFTGADYVTGQTGLSKPTNAGAVLDLWVASAGAPDWKGLYSGANALLKNIFGALYGLMFNVKSPQFGAKGNGVDDDAAAWQAAHDAAVAASGGAVVVPPGTYNIGAGLQWTTGVQLICMPGTVILQTTAAVPHITVSGNAFGSTETALVIYGLRFGSTIANADTQLVLQSTGNAEIRIIDCVFNDSDLTTGIGIALGGTMAHTLVRGCSFIAKDVQRLIFDNSNASIETSLHIEECDFRSLVGAAYSNEMVKGVNNKLNITKSTFYFQSTSGNTVGIYLANNSYDLVVSACRFIEASGGATSYAVQIFNGGRVFVSDDNYFHPSLGARYYQIALARLGTGFGYLAMGKYSIQTPGINVTLNDGFDLIYLRFSSTEPNITFPKIYCTGQELELIIENESGANWAGIPVLLDPSGVGTDFAINSSRSNWPAIDDQKKISVRFRSTLFSTFWRWQQIGDVVATEFQ